MPKGYSKEIMEALFKEEQEQQKKQAAEKEEKKRKQFQAYLEQVRLEEKLSEEERIAFLEKKVKNLKIVAIAALLIAVLAAAAVFTEGIQNLMLQLP